MKKSLLALGVMLSIFLSGCASGPDHKQIACSQMQDVIAASSQNSPKSSVQVESAHNFLDSALDVWLNNGGLQDDLYKLMSQFSETFKEFNESDSEVTETAYFDFQDKNMPKMEEMCGVEKTYIHTLKVSAGCFSGYGNVTADVQLNDAGKWKSLSKVTFLDDIELCNASPDYPKGSFFRIYRSTEDDTLQEFRVIFKPNYGTFSDGASKYVTCTEFADREDNTLDFENNWCG